MELSLSACLLMPMTASTPLRDAYPQLMAKDESRLSDAARGAKNVVKLLRERWPHVKFSARSSYYSQGSTIYVKWVKSEDNPPDAKEVRAMCQRFAFGSFDGMTDSYDYHDERGFTDLFGGARFVTAEAREPTPEERAAAMEKRLEKTLPQAPKRPKPRM